MAGMYQEFLGHFGLRQNPFTVSPNPQSFHSTAAHNEALMQLVFGTETRQGLMVLTGEPGTGKTTILLYFLDWLRQKHSYSTAYVFHTSLPSMDLLRLILRDFGIPSNAPSKGELLIALTDWLKERRRAGDCPVVVIDEAQALTNTALEEVRLLLNLEIDGAKLVQIVLAGQPQLEEKLRLPQMAQLRQRVMCHCRLLPFTPEDTAGYIVKRLAWGGSEDAGLFVPGTIPEIFRYSKGIPRVINLLCEHALLSSYADRRNSVDLGDVLGAVQEFELDETTGVGKRPLLTNTFCRLIPFPVLSSAETKAESKQKEFVPRSTEVPTEQGKEVKSTPELPCAEPFDTQAVAARERLPESCLSSLRSLAFQLPSHFHLYWHEVRGSFAGDCRQFVAACLEWLRKPTGLEGGVARSLNRVVRSTRNWLMSQ